MQSVDDLKLKRELENEQTVRLFNPLAEDFTVLFHGKPLTINALEIAVLPRPQAEHIKTHLTNHIINERGINLPNEDDIKAIHRELEVEL
jgi:hypothetical protein